MGRALVFGLALATIVACGGKKDAGSAGSGGSGSAPSNGSSAAGSGGSGGSATAPTPAAAVGSGGLLGGAPDQAASAFAGLRTSGALGLAEGSAPPAASDPAKAACDTACAHRATCNLGDAGGCTPECGALFDLGLFADADLKAYAAGSCDQAKQTEPQFQLAAACRKACAHRSECVQGASVKDCIPDCAALVAASKQAPDAVLADYVKKDCAAITADEPVVACLHGCVHVLTCGVQGDLPSCLNFCGQQLKSGATVEQVVEIGKMECDQVKQKIQLPQPEAAGAAGGGGGGGAGHHCTAAGRYRVCDKSGMCVEHDASEWRGAMGVEDAKRIAMQDCTYHLAQMVMIANINDRASTTQNCAITKCD